MVFSSLACATTIVFAAGLAQGATPWTVKVETSGRVALKTGAENRAALAAGLFATGWRGASLEKPTNWNTVAGPVCRGSIHVPGGGDVLCELRNAAEKNDSVLLDWTLTPQRAMTLNSLHVSLEVPDRELVGGSFRVDQYAGTFPEQFDGHTVNLHTVGAARAVELTFSSGRGLRMEFLQPVPVLVQDNRKWGPSFSVRIGSQSGTGKTWKKDESFRIEARLSSPAGVRLERQQPTVITAGADWIPLHTELDIQPGSALDFSAFGQLDPPAGRHGRVIAGTDGALVFEKVPDVPRRFYGVNFCFSAQYLPHADADRLAERLFRLGYNAVRLHHYERLLIVQNSHNSTELDPSHLDQLDYLFAALKKRGIYITTDLYVSRPVQAAEVFPGVPGRLEMDEFKMLVPVNERAFENWREFTRNLLTHENPYTGMTWAEDPALAWLSMINEGNFGNFIGRLSDRALREWTTAWNRWLHGAYVDDALLSRTWGRDTGTAFARNAMPLVKDRHTDSAEARDFMRFQVDTETAMITRMRRFLRDEVGTHALLTNSNGWTNPLPWQVARRAYDYVDDHFYVDHPQFLDKQWRLPSRCGNTNPVLRGTPGGAHCAFTRLLDRPFTISEYNYAAPSRYRSVGGILTGAMGAVQGWSAIWRFAYSHSQGNLFEPGHTGYFDLVADPINQAADRAAMCLFLRGDMRPALHAVALAADPKQLRSNPSRLGGVAPPWMALVGVTRVGSWLGGGKGRGPVPDLILPTGKAEFDAVPANRLLAVAPYAPDAGEKIVSEMRARGWLEAGNTTDLGKHRVESETGELLLDAPRRLLRIQTPRTVGIWAEAGHTERVGAIEFSVIDAEATLFATSLDGRAIPESRHLLITHLTEQQDAGTRFADQERHILLAWGKLPHLFRRGRARVTFIRHVPGRIQAWELSAGGRRTGPVPVATANGESPHLDLDVAGPSGARLFYEVVLAQADGE